MNEMSESFSTCTVIANYVVRKSLRRAYPKRSGMDADVRSLSSAAVVTSSKIHINASISFIRSRGRAVLYGCCKARNNKGPVPHSHHAGEIIQRFALLDLYVFLSVESPRSPHCRYTVNMTLSLSMLKVLSHVVSSRPDFHKYVSAFSSVSVSLSNSIHVYLLLNASISVDSQTRLLLATCVIVSKTVGVEFSSCVVVC